MEKRFRQKNYMTQRSANNGKIIFF